MPPCNPKSGGCEQPRMVGCRVVVCSGLSGAMAQFHFSFGLRMPSGHSDEKADDKPAAHKEAPLPSRTFVEQDFEGLPGSTEYHAKEEDEAEVCSLPFDCFECVTATAHDGDFQIYHNY